MRVWVIRGCVLGVLCAVAQLLLDAYAIDHPDTMTTVRAVALALLVGAGVAWGAVDAWLRLTDRWFEWVKAALVAGLLAALLTVIGDAIFIDQTSTSALGGALTGWAAFFALLVLLSAWLGLLLGRFVEPRAAREAKDRPTSTPKLPKLGQLIKRGRVADPTTDEFPALGSTPRSPAAEPSPTPRSSTPRSSERSDREHDPEHDHQRDRPHGRHAKRALR